MKKILLITFSFLFSFSFSQTKENDLRLLGAWQGSESGNQAKGVDKYWVQERFSDGTFTMLFLSIEDREATPIVDKGKWWTKDGNFYEFHYNTNLTDTYSYEILDELHVKFKLKNSNIEFSTSDYEFIDTKIIEGIDYRDTP